ncbi:MAG: hypothetical protein J6B44_09405 [Muribaculaceae bacterium]|nr:hypothetical protein [Muribaculaceae bacterium]
MEKLKAFIIISIINLICQNLLFAEDLDKYHRASLYSIILKHPEQRFSDEIIEAFKSIPIPDRFNDHNLKHTVLNAPIIKELTKEEIEGAYKDAIWNMLNRNQIGGRLVEKWFNYSPTSQGFDMTLIKKRGLYDASLLDINVALNTVRGKAILEDAGEELLSHTYILVNDIRYADKTTQRNLQGFAMMAGLFASSFIPGASAVAGTLYTSGVQLNDLVVGFKVYVTSYLFRLDWNKDVADHFYSNLWVEPEKPDSNEKYSIFKKNMSSFKLSYLGCTTIYSGKTSLAGVQNESDMFRKVCTRAIDTSISELQKQFDEFKVFSHLISTDPYVSYIGLKEGMTEESKYEVLEMSLDENGKTKYTRKGIIKPIKGMIWDNRYMAEFENGYDSSILGTAFEVVSGGGFYPGMLIREIE